jgi:hypothetical protein
MTEARALFNPALGALHERHAAGHVPGRDTPERNR